MTLRRKCDRLAGDARLSVALPTCAVCEQGFFKETSFQKVCRKRKCQRAYVASLEHAEKAERRADKARLAELDPRRRQKALAAAQEVVNLYVRLRDRDRGCVSCDRSVWWDGQWHASHFRSVGAASSVRFNLWNIHKACSICNNHLSGNLSAYEPRLRERIGDERVDWLRSQNQRADYSVEYLKRLRQVFAKKVQRLEKRDAMSCV